MRCSWHLCLLGGIAFAAIGRPAKAGLPPPVPPTGPPTHPPILDFADVGVEPPVLFPSPVIPGSTGYAATATIHSDGTIAATQVRIRVELRLAGSVLQSSELFLGDIPAGTNRTVSLPALFDTPLAPAFDLAAVVSSTNDSDPTNDTAVSHPSVAALPFLFHWAGFDLKVSGFDPSSTSNSMIGTGQLVLGTPPAQIPVSFSHVKVDGSANVTAGDPISASLTNEVRVTGSNGAELDLLQIGLPISGPMTVSGKAQLPATAALDSINGGATVPFAGKILLPSLTLKDSGITDLVLRDLPLSLHLSGPVDLALQGDALFALNGTAVGRPSWNLASPGLNANANASNDGLLFGNGGAPPPIYSLSGALQASSGVSGTLTMPSGATAAYVSLFPRAVVNFKTLQLSLAGGAISSIGGHVGIGYGSASSLPLDPHLVPTSRQPIVGQMDVRATDTSGGFAGSPTMALPADNRYAWVAPESDPTRKVFFAKDPSPILFMLGGETSSLPADYFVSRLNLESDGSLKTYPRSIGSAAAPLDPGLNLVTGVTSPAAAEEIDMNLVGSSGSITLPGPKLNVYLRAGGISGVWGSSTNAASPAATEMYGANGPGEWGAGRGFPLDFTNVSLGFLDTQIRGSNLSGHIHLRAPTGTGVTGDNVFDFAGMTVKNDGQIGEANVPPSGAATQELAFWKTLIQPKGVSFGQYNDYLGTTKTFLGINSRLGFAAGQYVKNPFAVDHLLFGGNGHPHPTRYGDPHLAMANRWMDFDFHPEGVRLSNPPDMTDASVPSTPLPWSDDGLPAAKATVQDRPGASNASPASSGVPGWVEVKGAAKLPYFGDKDLVTYVDARDNYVTLDGPVALHREFFSGMNLGSDQFVFQRSEPDKNGKARPNSFLGGFNWALPAGLLTTDGSIQLFDNNLGGDRARFFLGAEANVALIDTAGSFLDKAVNISDTSQQKAYIDKIYGKLGIVGKDYDPTKAAALATKITDSSGSPVPRGWASGIAGDIGTAHGVMQQLYDAAKDGSGLLSPASDAVNAAAMGAANFSKGLSGAIPVKLRYLRGYVELQDDTWDSLDAEAGGRIDRVLQDANVKFKMNRHNEYRLDLDAAKVTFPFTDLADGGQNMSEDRQHGLEIKNPYLHLLLKLPPSADAPRLDGSMGVGEFNLLDALTVNGVKIPPPSNQGLSVTNIDASFGIGPGLAYIGAALGLKGELINTMTNGVANSVSGAFLGGVGIDSTAIDLTGVLKPDIKAALLEGLAASGSDAKLNGLMVEAGFGNSLIDEGCFLSAGYSIDAAIWAFLVTGASNQAILGGRLYGKVDGQAVCVVGINGEITLLAQYTSADSNLFVKGTGHVGGSIDLVLTSIDFGAGVTATANTNPKSFNVDVSVD